jgi:methyl-accepting chemotaxis protein WspA
MKILDRLGVRNSSLARRLILWFGILVLIPMLISTLIIDRLSSRTLEKETLQKLTMIAKDKANSLELYAYERARGAGVLGRLKRLSDAALVLQNEKSTPAERAEAESKIQHIANYFAPSLGFTDTIVVCPRGYVLFQSRKTLDLGNNLLTGKLHDTPLATLAKRTLTLLEPDISDFALYPGSDLPFGFAAAPIVQEDGHKAGLLILQINTREVYDIINDYAGLGRTGQIVIGALRNGAIHVAAPLRANPEAMFKVSVKPGADYGIGIQNAMSGNQGVGEVTNILKKPVMASWTYIPSFRWGMSVQQDIGEAMAMVSQQRWTMLGILAAILLPTLLIALGVARSISRPIQTAVAAAERVASGDLSATLSAEGSDEISKLINALGQMVNYLNSLIGQVQRSTIDLVSTANSLSAMTKTQSEEVSNLGSTTTEIAAATKEISATSEELLSTMSGITEVADHTTELANSGQSSLGDMEGAMRTLADATHSISSRLGLINEKANTISSVTTTITKIADQTNLLSLNASIEAEKAGEYGLGFAVLAREIRRLADQTAVATLDIEQMVKEMQDSVTGGVMEMDKFSEQVSRSVSDTHDISLRFGEIIQQIQALLPQFDAVHEGMRSQSAGAKQIRDSMVSLTDSVRVSAQALDETTSATQRLEGAIDELRNEISSFKLR